MTAIKFVFIRVMRQASRIMFVVAIAFSLCGVSLKCHARYWPGCVDRQGVAATPNNVSLNIDGSTEYPSGTLIDEPYVDDYEVVFTFTGQECTGTGTSTWAHSFGVSIGTYSAPEGNLPVYYLAEGGIGYAMAIADPNQPYQGLELHPGKPLWGTDRILTEGKLGTKFRLYLVTTNPLLPGDYLVPVSTLANVCIASSQTEDTRDFCASIDTRAFIISVKVGGCDIDADTPALVNLARINASELTHKGDVGDNVDFAISLTCNGTTTVNMNLTDPNGGDAENGVLYSDKGDGLAENVGIQILSVKDGGQTPQTVHLNESFTVGDASDGHYEIPMSVRYYRTSDSEIVGGKVSASVVYELSYQ